jgi:hypothetical protein
MAISEELIKKLSAKYPANTMVDLRHGGKDMTIKTDEHGNAILLFIGKKKPDGKIKGERYARRLLVDANGAVIKDHWDLKGRSE